MRDSIPYSHTKPILLRNDKTDYSEEAIVPLKKSKGKKYCPKLKGPCSFELKEVTIHKHFPATPKRNATSIKEYRCEACNKKDLRFFSVTI